MEPLQKLAKGYYEHFVTIRNGDAIGLSDNRPEILRDICQAAHGDMFPDDYRYQYIMEAMELIAEYDVTDEARDSIEADVYTHDLTAWLASRNDRSAFVDEYSEEIGFNGQAEMERIAAGQWMERTEVFNIVLGELESIVGI